MPGWSYRIVHHDTDGDPGEHFYALHEVFYGPDGGINFISSKRTAFDTEPYEGPDSIVRMLRQALHDVETGDVLSQSALLSASLL